MMYQVGFSPRMLFLAKSKMFPRGARSRHSQSDGNDGNERVSTHYANDECLLCFQVVMLVPVVPEKPSCLGTSIVSYFNMLSFVPKVHP